MDKSHPSRETELARLASEVAEKSKSIGRYLRAFEKGRMSEASAGARVRELEQEVGALEADRAVIEAELQKTPTVATKAELDAMRARITQAIENSEPELLKELLAGIIDEIVVESRKSITPYFVSPGVLTLAPSRRRKPKREKSSVAGERLSYQRSTGSKSENFDPVFPL